MRCLQCGKRLSVLRRLAGSEFCSESHKRQYMEEQETLGLARLIESKRQTQREGREQNKKTARKALAPGTPPFIDEFLPQPPLAKSVVLPCYRPGDPIAPAVELAAPQQDLDLGRCLTNESAAGDLLQAPPTNLAADGASVAGVAFSSEAILPGAPPATVNEGVPSQSGPLPVPIVAESAPAGFLTEPPAQLAPAYGPLLPQLGLEVPSSLSPAPPLALVAQAPSGPGCAPPAPGHLPMAASACLPRSPFPEPGSNETHGQAAAGNEEPAVAGFTLRLRPLPAADEGRGILAERVRFAPTKYVLPVLRRALFAEPEVGRPAVLVPSSRGADASGVSVPPVAEPFRSGANLPGAVRMVFRFEPRLQEPVAVPVGCAEVPSGAAAELPQPTGLGAFLLPPPDLRLATPSLGQSNDPVRLVMTAACIGEVHAGDHAGAVPLGPHAGPPRLPGWTPILYSPGFDKAAAASAAREPHGLPPELTAAGPVDPTLPAVRVPRSSGSKLPSELPAHQIPADPMATAAEPNTMGAPRPAKPLPKESTDAGCADVRLPSGASQLPGPVEAVETPAHPVEHYRPGLLLVGLDRVIPRDDVAEHKTALEIRTMAPKPLVPASGLTTVAEPGPTEPSENRGAAPWARVWGPIIERSRSLRGGAIWAGVAGCLVLAFALRSPWTSQVPAPVASEVGEFEVASETPAEVVSDDEGFRTVLASRWDSIREDVSQRAAINLADDFRAGLADWTGEDGWAQSWSYDDAGFVRPGTLALYAPTLSLTDYDFTFAAQVEQNGVSWVVRAADSQNYYAIRLAITDAGPLPKAAIIRYPVTAGRRGPITRTDVPFTLRLERMHTIATRMQGSSFTVFVDGTLVDFWRETGFQRGGVGFIRGAGESSRLRWVNVSHQYDLLGRLCALLAPYNFEQASRSIEP